tara:strand:+ start:1186 stop:7074 length:5889 start_codon:yes stop_codon:yes gene_type:complete
MGLLDMVKGVGGGALEMIEGTAGFAVDTVKATVQLGTGDLGGAASTWFESWQEDVLGSMVSGAFGPEGIIGSVVGALPEDGPFGFIRTGGRDIITPAMEAWDTVMQTVIDDKLGTFAMVMHAGLRGGNPMIIFDGSTWTKAHKINSQSFDPVTGERIEGHGRTFGQSVAAALWITDPFDHDQYNAIKEDPLFNVFSGALDFAQEFLDPIDILLGGGANLLSGKTAVGFKTSQGNVKILGHYKNADGQLVSRLGRRHLAPQREYINGGGRGWRRRDQIAGQGIVSSHLFKELTPEQKKIRQQMGNTSTQARASSFIASNKWAMVEDAFAKVDKRTLDSKAKDYLSPEAAAQQRASILRNTVGRRGAKMPEEATFAIANGRTAEARRLTTRAVMGDMTAYRDAGDAAAKLIETIDDADGYLKTMGRVENLKKEIDDLSSKLDNKKIQQSRLELKYEKSGKDITPGQKSAVTKLKNEITRLEGEINNLTNNRLAKNGGNLNANNLKLAELQKPYDAVDFEMMFDFSIAAHTSQIQRVANNPVGSRINDISEVMAGDAGMKAMSEMMLRSLADADNFGDFARIGIDKRAMGIIPEVRRWRSLDNYVGAKVRSMGKLGKAVTEDVYHIPSVITPFGFRTFRIFTERLPQTLIEFNDPLAFAQFERMLSQASKVKIRGQRLSKASKEIVDQTLGEWTEILQRSDINKTKDLRDLYQRTKDGLVKEADDLISDAANNGINAINIGGKTLREELEYATNLKNIAQKKTGDAPLARKVPSVKEIDDFSFEFYPDNTGGVQGVIHGSMSPQMVLQSELLPRFDLINTQLRDLTRLDGKLHHRALVATKDGVKRVTKYPRRGAEVVQGFWRPAVLLTPKWPMRVQLDEVLRRMADLGTISEMRNLFGAMGNLKDQYAGRSIEGGLTNIPIKLREAAQTKTKKSGKEINKMSEVEILNLLDEKDVKKVVLESAKEARIANKQRRWLPSAIRGYVGLTLINPIAGAAWAGMYGISQFRRSNNVAIRRAGISHADLHMKEAKRLLQEALEDGNPALIQYGEFLIDQGANMNSILDALHKFDIDVSEVRNSVEKADMLLSESGFDNLKIGGVVARGAFGDDASFTEMISKSVSSSKSQSAMFRGYKRGVERELRKYTSPDWQRWDANDPAHAKIFEQGFSETLERYTSIGDKWQSSFFNHVWGDGTREVRIQNLSEELVKNKSLQANLGHDINIKKVEDAGDSVLELTNEIATNIIDEYDGILPQGALDRTREKAKNQGAVTWTDVKQELKEKFPDTPINTIITDIRNGKLTDNAHSSFGRSVAPHPSSIDTQRSAMNQQVGVMLERIFENLGTLPADNLSRNPYYKTKYNRAVYQSLAPFMDEAGNVQISATQLRRVEDQSRKAALRETRDLLYDLAEETRIGEMTAMIMPFYNAWQEVIGRWSKLGQENPAFVAKAARLYMSDWNAEVLGITEVHDVESGASFLAFRLPEGLLAGTKKWTEANLPNALQAGPLVQMLANNPIRLSKEGLASMLQSTTPGFGPLVSIPIREAVLADPSLEETFSFMFPFGHPEGGLFDRVKSNLLPAYGQNIENILADTPTKERVAQSFALQIFVERAEAGNPVDIEDTQQLNAMIEEANSRTIDFFKFRVATGLLMPTSTSVFSPYDDLMKVARNLQKEHGTMKGNQLFLEEYGHELFALTARMTRLNDGVGASATSEAAFIEHQELVGNHPDVGGWVTGSLGSGDEEFKFNQAVYRRQTQMEISSSDPRKRRERKTIYETIADTEVERGWSIYTVYKDKIREEQDKRRAAGLDYSLASQDMFGYRQLFNGVVNQLKIDIPSWGAEFDQKTRINKMPNIIEGFMAGLQKDSILQRASTTHVIAYFDLRGFIESELITRSRTKNPETGRVGSDNLGSNSNADLMLMWETQREDLAIRPEFTKIYDRYFELDFISKDSFVSKLDPAMWNKFMNGEQF